MCKNCKIFALKKAKTENEKMLSRKSEIAFFVSPKYQAEGAGILWEIFRLRPEGVLGTPRGRKRKKQAKYNLLEKTVGFQPLKKVNLHLRKGLYTNENTNIILLLVVSPKYEAKNYLERYRSIIYPKRNIYLSLVASLTVRVTVYSSPSPGSLI